MFTVEYSPRAREDVTDTLLTAIETYASSAEKLEEELKYVLGLLKGQPRMGTPRDDGFREVPIKMFKRMIVYYVNEKSESIYILRIVPMSSDWKDKKYTLH